MVTTTQGLFRAKVNGNLRNGICNSCGIRMVSEKIILHGEEKVIMRCKKCGGTTGQLIARSVSIQAPSPPQCVSIRCLRGFANELILCGLLSTYHRKRVEYAQRNRHKKIAQKYRTGEESPINIRQAVFAIIKLTIIGGIEWHKLRQ